MTAPRPRAARRRWLPPTRRGRLALAAGVVLGLPVATLALVAFSVWSEARFPSDGETQSTATRARGVVTRPIVRAIGRIARDRMRSNFQRRMLMTGLPLEETIARLRDASRTPAERAVHAHRLARIGSPEAVDALLDVFRTAAPEHRPFLAQLIGSTGDPRVAPWLLPLLDDPDERLVIAAIRGLAALDGYDAAGLLEGILGNPARSSAVRVEAAMALGQIGSPQARDALALALDSVHDDGGLAEEVLAGLGAFPFGEVAAVFGGVLDDPERSPDTRVAAAEALAHSSRDALPFLVELVRTDEDPDVRASAAWAISAHDGERGLAPTLATIAEQEPDEFVRRRVYEALQRQPEIPAERLLPRIRAEGHVATRVAGLNAVGRAIGHRPRRAATAEFDASAVPELERIATTDNSLNVRMRAVFALRRARTEAARAALATIAETPCRQVAAAARNGLSDVH